MDKDINKDKIKNQEILSEKTIKEMDEAKEKEALKKIEAALFISGRYMSIEDLVSHTNINPLLLKELIEKLKENYDKDHTSLNIIKKGELFKMDVKPDYTELINKFASGSSEFTKAEQETLAIISYKQPIKQSVIVKIRGNKAYEHIKKFIDLQLVKAKKLGHTKELALSDDFYDYFGVEERQEEKNNKDNLGQ